MIAGHEGLGEIAEVGETVWDVEPGDYVLTNPDLSCGHCRYCRQGVQHLCEHKRVMGFLTWGTEHYPDKPHMFSRYRDGTLAEYFRIPATNVEKLRPDDDLDAMYNVFHIGYGYRALKDAASPHTADGGFHSGETVIVNGGSGVLGIGTTLAALAMGADQVIVSARNQDRLAHVRSIDPDRITTISVLEDSIYDTVMDVTEGLGANVLIDATPQGIETFHECMKSLETGGRIVIIGGNTETIEFEYKWFNANQFMITGDAGLYYKDTPEIIKLIRNGVIDPSPLVHEYFELDEANEALDFYETYDGPQTKLPVIRPH